MNTSYYRRLAVAAGLLLVAHTASAIPLEFSIDPSGGVTHEGEWVLDGPLSDSEAWGVQSGSYTANRDLVAGTYDFSMSGQAYDQGNLTWDLTVGGDTIFDGQISGQFTHPIHGGFEVFEDGSVFALEDLASVPEPSSLLLFGFCLAGLGFAAFLRRRPLTGGLASA